MKILGDVISPFTRMALVMAYELGLGDRVKLVGVHAKMAEVNAELQKLSPIAKIPVLVTDHNHAIHDSRVIMEYLAHVAGNSTMIPDDGVKRFRVLTLLATAQGAADAAVLLRYETAMRPENLRWPEYADRLRARILASAAEIEEHWSDQFANINVGTIGLACMLSYVDLRHGNLDWRSNSPKLKAFHEGFSARPSMLAWPLPE
jgi:glutathione S-transferase